MNKENIDENNILKIWQFGKKMGASECFTNDRMKYNTMLKRHKQDLMK